jgi:hypothetical protein
MTTELVGYNKYIMGLIALIFPILGHPLYIINILIMIIIIITIWIIIIIIYIIIYIYLHMYSF